MRRGQVALYLIVVLLAITILTLMNVNVFLSVRSKDRAMNGGDAAALAVAKWQGELLNRIGAWNIEHLKAAIADDGERCAELAAAKIRTCFLEPIHGITKGNEAAKDNGIAMVAGANMSEVLRQHVNDILQFFVNDSGLYPEPWEGAWNEYASVLGVEIAEEMQVGPDAVEFVDMRRSFPLTEKAFYNAIAGRQWCWFKFYGMWLFDRDVDSLPLPDYSSPAACVNSEIYPLHLTFGPLPPVLDDDWVAIITRLTGCSEKEIRESKLLTDQSQRFAFFGCRWNSWSDYSDDIQFRPEAFPIVGEVKPEYDVLGCAARCRVVNAARDIMSENEDGERIVHWTAAAKPFGTVVNLEGRSDVVTALKRFVTPCFGDVRLVPVDSVAASDISDTADWEWMRHVKFHIASSPYYQGHREPGCWYCQQLKLWDSAAFRKRGVDWLRYHGESCVRPIGHGSCGTGGTAHAH